jgi:hypothetical protein
VGRLAWYVMAMRSSSVLEHTMRPSALVTTTPPELREGVVCVCVCEREYV